MALYRSHHLFRTLRQAEIDDNIGWGDDVVERRPARPDTSEVKVLLARNDCGNRLTHAAGACYAYAYWIDRLPPMGPKNVWYY
jgi:hypothetical protein